MPIRVNCECGKSFAVADQYAGKKGKCPGCGHVVQVPAGAVAAVGASSIGAPSAVASADPVGVHDAAPPPALPPSAPAQPLQYVTPGRTPSGPIAPPPELPIHLPTSLPPKFHSPGCPPCNVVFITQGADIEAGFDVSPVLQSFAEGLAKKLKKRFDVQFNPPAPGSAAVFVRFIQIDEGNRWLRYFLGIFFGGTRLEIDGNVVNPAGVSKPYTFKHVGRAGLFGGSSLALLKVGGKHLGGKVGKLLLKA